MTPSRLVVTAPYGSLVVTEYSPASPRLAFTVQVRNHATSLNHLDWKRIRANFLMPSFPQVLGMDIAGVVADNGTSTKYRVGDRIIAPGVPGWSDACSFQTHALLQESHSSKIPDNMAFEEAATLPFCLMTAACGLFVNLGLSVDGGPENKGWILIWGANGAVGSLAIQLARIANYSVIAVTSTTGSTSQARDHGADFAFSKDDPDLISKIAEYSTRPKWALDTVVSLDTIEQISRCIEPSGIIATAQKYTGETVPGATLSNIFAEEMFGKTMTGEVSHRGQQVAEWLWSNLYGWLSTGHITPLKFEVIGGLSEVENGLKRLGAGTAKMKLVVKI